MNFVLERKRTADMLDEIISFRGELRASDLLRLPLSAFDRALLEEISGDTKAEPADYLLGLEMIFRRYAEQLPNAYERCRKTLAEPTGAQMDAYDEREAGR